MKIVRIFAEKLFAFHYDNENENELARLLEQWNDAHWLYGYFQKNGLNTLEIYDFSEEIFENLSEMENLLDNIENDRAKLNELFRPLDDSHSGTGVLIFQKGKLRNNKLRLYALKIADDCYVITGGAIKMSQSMQGHRDTAKELQKLTKAKEYLKTNDVFDDDSFYEFLTEQL